MRRGRGARTRFPVVCGKAVPFTGRIAGLWGTESGSGGETAANPAGGRWLLSPRKIHVSPFLCASSAPHRRNHDWSCSESAAQPPRRKDPPPPHEYVDLLSAQRLGGTSHYEGSTFDREEENLTPCLPTHLDLRTVLFPPRFLGEENISEIQTFASLKGLLFSASFNIYPLCGTIVILGILHQTANLL